ncbi:MAG TPA: hypothetical protein ENH29_08810 [Bacteroidetes bacterium]|nr:hypothetical protein [Bacteroidota bacterium]
MKYSALILLLFFVVPSAGQSGKKVVRVTLPEKQPVFLLPFAQFNFEPINEASGLVKSRKFPNLFWMHNDSGDKAGIFAVRKDGGIVKSKNALNAYDGIHITSAQNHDWEDIAADNAGNLIIADSGNNKSKRKNLAVYFVKEPDPTEKSIAKAYKKIRFYYPDQHGFPPVKKNFDAEAIFWAKGKLYLLTKHRSDTYTKLYRFDLMDGKKTNPLTLLGTFNAGGMVTAADASPNGNKVVVLTYTAVWLFEISGTGDDYFHGKISWLPIFAKQCEGVCFDGDAILISNEQRDLYQLPLDQLIVVKK